MALPPATDDLDRARADLDGYGCCLIADALSSDDLRALRQRLVDAAAEDVDAGRAFRDSGGANQRVWALLNRGQVFCNLATHAIALAMMDRALAPPSSGPAPNGDLPGYLLGSITANITGPGGEPMPLHADQSYVPHPWPPFPLVVNIAWMLDDFTEANGATRVVPGSHRVAAAPDRSADERAVPAEGAAGTALVFDGRLWHGTGRNTTTDRKRHGILTYYCRPWMRTQENHTVSTDPEVVAQATPALRRLLGFDLYWSLGMINGLAPLGVKRS